MIRAPWIAPAAALLFLGAGCASGPASHRDVALRMVEAINTRQLDALDALVARDVVRHCAATPDVAVESLDDFKSFLRQDFATVPDSVVTVGILLEDGDYVALYARYRGTQEGPMGPFPPSHRPFECPFLGILRFENGKIVEMWVEWDNLSALAQLGHFPPAPEAAGG
jgi:predicted ester cyclase